MHSSDKRTLRAYQASIPAFLLLAVLTFFAGRWVARLEIAEEKPARADANLCRHPECEQLVEH